MIKIKTIAMGALLSSFMLGTTSCDDGFIFEDEGDCTPKVQFIFKKHRQALQSVDGREPDAFYSSVESVHIFVYDAATNELVFEKTEKTSNLNSASELNIGSGEERCYLPIDVLGGTYRIVAWCGMDENDENNAFNLVDGTRGGNYSHCSVKYDAQGNPVKEAKYDNLYHGVIESIEVRIDGDNPQIIPIELTKNNNDIAVWVQHTNRVLEDGEYEVVYVDSNGEMEFKSNSVTSTTSNEYHAHTSSNLTTSTEYNGSVVETGALVAHISTSRLMEANKNNARLEVRTKEGDAVFSIPFIKYVLQMQTFTNDGQKYLDCEDTYNCSFYLTGNDETFMPARIIINNWVVVPQQTDEL